ncbi:MAG: RlmE family RNA methyltransferase [Nanoarchaeota archaeon]|nr:RlmE family RNA methyltransferase [Nanoarchaeota archaeon]
MQNRKDYYFKKAKTQGYLARSIYKLLEINKKYNLITPNSRVLDLGTSPGSWVQACLKLKVKEIIGIDITEAKIKNPNFVFLKEDISKLDIKNLKEFDVVLSDLAPSTSGNKQLDSEKSIELSDKAFNIAKKVLKPNGNFLVKVFQGPGFEELFNEIRKNFKFCKSYKPKSTRKSSKEIYIVAKNFINN